MFVVTFINNLIYVNGLCNCYFVEENLMKLWLMGFRVQGRNLVILKNDGKNARNKRQDTNKTGGSGNICAECQKHIKYMLSKRRLIFFHFLMHYLVPSTIGHA